MRRLSYLGPQGSLTSRDRWLSEIVYFQSMPGAAVQLGVDSQRPIRRTAFHLIYTNLVRMRMENVNEIEKILTFKT